MLYHDLMKRNKYLQKRIHYLKNQLSEFPNGYLTCSRNGNYIKYFHVTDGSKTYIPTKNQSLIHALARKKYLSAVLNDLLQEQKSIDSFLKHYRNHSSNVSKLLDHPSYQKIISNSLTPLSEELAKWEKAPYNHNPSHPDNLIHPCLSGHIVRSKSESFIDQALFTHQIPFRYECELKLGEIIVYPDFSIRHPETGQLFLWEHFGFMNSTVYSQNSIQKLQLYTANGFIPTINLITTYETKECPLNTEKVETIIQYYFC